MKVLIKSKLFRYIVVGGASYLIEISILISLSKYLDLSGTVAVAISFWFGLASSFILQKVIAFKSVTNYRDTSKQMVMYMALVAVNYAFTVGFVFLAQDLIGLVESRTVALIVTTSWNFLLYNKIIFKLQ